MCKSLHACNSSHVDVCTSIKVIHGCFQQKTDEQDAPGHTAHTCLGLNGKWRSPTKPEQLQNNKKL